ncbi:MAG TPA: transglycosylase family protein [Solirubrobacteraceae bacterium]|nr:transglycosylase family protein [Solirubrobacteraceae bacterium]
MRSHVPHPPRSALVALGVLTAAVVAALVMLVPVLSRADDLGTLKSQLGAQQARQRGLAGSIGQLNQSISRLDGQITLVRSREATVNAELARRRAELARVGDELTAERAHLQVLRRRLAAARTLLAAQLRSGYETDRPDLMTVVLSSHGFQSLLTKLSFLGDAQHAQQQLITITVSAKQQAAATAKRLAALKRTDARLTHETAVQARALAGMNALLDSREAALSRARAAQSAALDASRATSQRLRGRISAVEAAQRAAARRAAAAAAARAAAAAAGASSGGGGGGGGTSAAPSGGWAIPEAIVMCESGGQNLPPNSAGASGYYQIIPSTWRLFGGTGPAAYLTSLSEQSAVASRIWNGGAGASNWVCASIVGITH